MACFILLPIVGLLTFLAFYKWVNRKYEYFEKRNQPFLKPYFLVGGTGGLNFGRYAVPEFVQMIYNSFPNEKFFGMFDFLSPTYVIRDPELLKQITIKDFDHFEDHVPFVDEGSQDLFGNSLVGLKGQKWRDMRATLSPAFTGSKMRLMFKLVTECSDNMTKYLVEKSQQGERLNIEVKDLYSRTTNDMIASCAFGIKVNSLDNAENEFLTMGRKMLEFPILRSVFVVALPKLARKLNINFIPDEIANYFRSIIRETMSTRTRDHIYRPDLINILMQVRQGKIIDHETGETDIEGFATAQESYIGRSAVRREWTEDELIGQAFVFFFAGFESSANMISFLSYEIAINRDIQEKLYAEIKATHDKLSEPKVNYDSLQKMKYMDQVVCEVLRKWPPAGSLDRLCVKDYVYNDGDTSIHIEKDALINIPLYGFHHDPQYFPNPEVFDPERFSDENRSNIISGTYFPFGIGPRNCIASRFALMQIKAMVYYIILNFKLEPNENTQIPLRLKNHQFMLMAENGIHLDLIPRQQ